MGIVVSCKLPLKIIADGNCFLLLIDYLCGDLSVFLKSFYLLDVWQTQKR